MGKRSSPPRLPPKTEFRESDFAGMPPQEKAQLSGSLNRLSEQLANTRQLLQQFEQGAPFVEGLSPGVASAATPAPVAPRAPTPTDDGTPVPP